MIKTHPLTPFVHWNRSAPYFTADLPGPWSFSRHRRIVSVNCKSGLARGSRGPVRFVHRVEAMAAVFDGGKAQLAARWLCGATGTRSAVVVANAKGFEMCPACEDRHAGPAVYRLFAHNGALIYIGASAELSSRLRDHELAKPWWPDVAEVRVERFANMPAAFKAEDAAIKAEGPLHNQRLQAAGFKATERAA